MMIFHRWFSSVSKALSYGIASILLIGGSVFAADLQAPEGLEDIPHVPVIFSTPPTRSVVGYPNNTVLGSGNPGVTVFGACGLGSCTSIPIDIGSEDELNQLQQNMREQRGGAREANERLEIQRGILN